MKSLKYVLVVLAMYLVSRGTALAEVSQAAAAPAPAAIVDTTASDMTNEILADMKKELNLTAAQIEMIRPLVVAHETMENNYFYGIEQKLDSLLTPAQRARFSALKAQVQVDPGAVKGKDVAAELGLSAEQMAQMRAYVQENGVAVQADTLKFFTSLRAVLNSAQQAKLDQILATPLSEDEAPHR